MKKRNLLVLAVLAVAGVLLSGCAEYADPDNVGLYYMKGPSDGYKFGHCMDPGKADDAKWNNEIIWLPNNIRTWNIAAQGGDTNVPITVASKPEKNQPSGVQVNVWSQTNLMLNTTCVDKDSILVRFWERLGKRYGANTEEGWKKMLLNTVVPALEKAERTVVRNYIADSLVAGIDLQEVQQKVSEQFALELKRVTGEDYFCGPTFQRGSESCPPVEVLIKDVDYADPGIQEARNNKQKAIENAAALLAEAQGKLDAANKQSQLYQNAAWVDLQKAQMQLDAVKACAANPNCTVILNPSGSGTIVNSK